MNPKKELLWSLWVEGCKRAQNGFTRSRQCRQTASLARGSQSSQRVGTGLNIYGFRGLETCKSRLAGFESLRFGVLGFTV